MVFKKKFFKSIIVLSFLFSSSILEIIENPIKITEHSEPSVEEKDNNYIIYSQGEVCNQVKETGEVNSCQEFCTYPKPNVIYTQDSSNKYIYCPNGYYSVSSSSYSCGSFNSVSSMYTDSNNYIGLIPEGYYKDSRDNGIFGGGGYLCSQVDKERVIYGKNGSDKIKMTFIQKNKEEILSVCSGLEDVISCKNPKNSVYVCAIICNNKVYIYAFIYKTSTIIPCKMENLSSKQVELLSSHTRVTLYDTSNNEKLLCAINKNTNIVECINISYKVQENTPLVSWTITYEFTINLPSSIIYSFPISSSINEYCKNKQFGTEYLFCCGGTDIIKCQRIDKDYKVTSSFELKIEGYNSQLDILTSSSFATIFYENRLSSINTIFSYYIFIPECINTKSYTILIYHSINENKEEDKEKIEDFFKRRTNTKYYIQFDTLPTAYGDLIFDNKKLTSISEKILIPENNNIIIDFNSTNNEIVQNFKVNYTISINETYSTQCYFTLTINPCYDSCKYCSKEKTSSEEHNCLSNSCNADYYTDPTIDTNCWKISEKKSNWYFDNNENKFGVCDISCATCEGPLNTNCTSCFPISSGTSLIYLFEGKCLEICPDGYYSKINPSNYYDCLKCFDGCETCSTGGDKDNMKCDYCKANYISYLQNCYKEYNSDDKSFFLGDGITISSCYELNNLYIEEGTYECLNSYPSSGVYISNTKTGLYSPCHTDCKTCSMKTDSESTHCDSCKNEDLYISEGKCLVSCLEGYIAKDSLSPKMCKKCFEACSSCSDEPLINSYTGKVDKMNCLSCKKSINSGVISEKYIKIEDNCFPIVINSDKEKIFDTSAKDPDGTEKTCLSYGSSWAIYYDKYECIIKPENTFYIIEGESNTGVIRNCDEACSSCIGNATSNNTNCYECNDNFYKTIDSATNCLPESLIPKNYYKNEEDNIYYPCYYLCASCTNYFDASKNNMSCIICINNYYFENGTNNCYPESHADEGFFLVENIWYPCNRNCKVCSAPGTDNTQNCITCKDGKYLMHETTNCFSFEDMTNKPYYLDYDIFEWKKCYDTCGTCIERGNSLIHNCQTCLIDSKTYYFMDGTNNCYDDTKKNEGYYLFEEIFYKCPSNCTTCNEPSTDDSHCIGCIDEHYFVYGTGNCYEIDFKEKGYYLSTADNKFHECYPSCSLCSASGSNNNHNCNECKDSYYFEDKTKNCYQEQHKNDGYYLLDNIFYPCFKSCQTCNELGIDSEHKCLSCKVNFYFEENTSNCFDLSYLQKGYYLSENQILKKCYIFCIECDEKGTNDTMKCKKCVSNYYLEYDTTNCYDISYKENSYYLEPKDQKFHKCFEKCKLCSISGAEDVKNNIYKHNCEKCIDNYYFEEGTNNCYDMEHVEKGFYLDTFTINPDEGELPQFKRCYSSCKTCTNKMINKEMNCLLCIPNYYKVNGTNNCQKDLQPKGYYLEEEIFYPCSENCLTCSKGPIIINNFTMNNCLSCDKFNKGLYLVDKLNSCESLTYKKNGYYLGKNDEGVEILYKCYDSCLLCDKGLEIDENTGKENFNCIDCISDYYILKGTKNCYNDEMKEKGYNLVRNQWQICYETCEECFGRQIFNPLGEVVSHNCITCYEEYKFIYETSDCANNSILLQGYYLDDIDEKYHKCDIRCATCNKPEPSDGGDCISCNNIKGYFQAEDKPNNKCYNSWDIGGGYFLAEEYNEITESFEKIWKTCYSLCNSCIGKGNEIENLCINCISKYYKIHNTSNCVQDKDILPYGYYFSNTLGEYVKCHPACLNCKNGEDKGNTNCLECNKKDGYFIAEGRESSFCYNNDTIISGYYLNINDSKWEKCYERCATCIKKGYLKEMSCISCKQDFTDESGELLDLIFYEGNCLEECPDNLLLTPYKECVSKCPSGLYKLTLGKSCVENCPEGYILNSQGTACLLSSNNIVNISSEELISSLTDDLASNLSPTNVLEGEDFKVQVMGASDLDTNTQLEQGVSAIDLGNCLTILKEHYNIPEDEDIIVLKIDSTPKDNYDTSSESSSASSVQFFLYDISGNELDFSLCSEISIIKPIGDIEGIDIGLAQELSEKGIDAFNSSDDYFNDICHPYGENGADLTVSDRRSDLYQNVSFCDPGCKYDGVDYDTLAVKCSCSAKDLKESFESNKNSDPDENKLTINSITNAFTSDLYGGNYVLAKCVNLVFNLKNLRYNIGFYIFLGFFTCELVIFSFYLKQGVIPVENFMLIFEPYDPNIDPSNPPLKKKQNEFNTQEKGAETNFAGKGSNFPNNNNSNDGNINSRVDTFFSDPKVSMKTIKNNNESKIETENKEIEQKKNLLNNIRIKRLKPRRYGSTIDVNIIEEKEKEKNENFENDNNPAINKNKKNKKFSNIHRNIYDSPIEKTQIALKKNKLTPSLSEDEKSPKNDEDTIIVHGNENIDILKSKKSNNILKKNKIRKCNIDDENFNQFSLSQRKSKKQIKNSRKFFSPESRDSSNSLRMNNFLMNDKTHSIKNSPIITALLPPQKTKSKFKSIIKDISNEPEDNFIIPLESNNNFKEEENYKPKKDRSIIESGIPLKYSNDRNLQEKISESSISEKYEDSEIDKELKKIVSQDKKSDRKKRVKLLKNHEIGNETFYKNLKYIKNKNTLPRNNDGIEIFSGYKGLKDTLYGSNKGKKNKDKLNKLNLLDAYENFGNKQENKIKIKLTDNNNNFNFTAKETEDNLKTNKRNIEKLTKMKKSKGIYTQDDKISNKNKEYYNKKHKQHLINKKVSLALSYEDYIEMDYDTALKKDKRKCIQFYWGYLLLDHIVFYTFVEKGYLELRTIKLSLFVFSLALGFFLNAFFYTDEYISDTYKNNGVLDFISSLPKSIYSFLISQIISILLKHLSSNSSKLREKVLPIDRKLKFLEELNISMKELKRNLTILFIIVFILTIGSWYYATAFCAVYHNSQFLWLYGCLESVALDFSIPFGVCILISLFRHLGLRQRSKCFYSLSNLIDFIL